MKKNDSNFLKRNYITSEEQKTIMLNILKYIDGICRKHEIPYSLIGGSLIGAIRHGGFIPWDDDVDIILTKENYKRLRAILEKETGRYQMLKFGHGGERFPFIKVVDTKTCAIEHKQAKYDENYGIYVDVFCYYPAAENERDRLKQYKRIKFLMKILSRLKIDFENKTLMRNIKQIGKNSISRIVGYKRINRAFYKTFNEYEDSNYLLCNWLVYSFDEEVQLKKNTEEYIDVDFEGLNVMIFKNYDEILRTNFGDYMQLPPESERVPKHNMKMWWREGCEDEEEKIKNNSKAKSNDD